MFAPEESSVSDQDAEQLLSELSNDLMSPFCPGRTISACTSSGARRLEDRILEEAKSGKSRDEIEQSLVADYGSEIIGYRPPPSLMVTTVFGGVLALALLIWFGRRWVRKARPAAAPAGGVPAGGGPARPSAAELDLLEDALDDEDGF